MTDVSGLTKHKKLILAAISLVLFLLSISRFFILLVSAHVTIPLAILVTFSIELISGLAIVALLFGSALGHIKIDFLRLFVFSCAVILGIFLISVVAAFIGSGSILTSSNSNVSNFLEYKSNFSGNLEVVGGIAYLIRDYFPLIYPASWGGIGGYSVWFEYMLTHQTLLYLPQGGMIYVPEYVHMIVYIIVIILFLIFSARLVRWLLKKLAKVDYGDSLIKNGVGIGILTALGLIILGAPWMGLLIYVLALYCKERYGKGVSLIFNKMSS